MLQPRTNNQEAPKEAKSGENSGLFYAGLIHPHAGGVGVAFFLDDWRGEVWDSKTGVSVMSRKEFCTIENNAHQLRVPF